MRAQLVTHLVPEALLYPIWRWYTSRRPRTVLSTASDRHIFDIQEGVRLEVYWARQSHSPESLGPGPGASLFVRGDEVLRLDCFGGSQGHFHINPRQVGLTAQVARFFFPEGTYEDHIDQAAFELSRNLPSALAMNRDPQIRRVKLDNARLDEASMTMRKTMLELLGKHRGDLPRSSQVSQASDTEPSRDRGSL